MRFIPLSDAQEKIAAFKLDYNTSDRTTGEGEEDYSLTRFESSFCYAMVIENFPDDARITGAPDIVRCEGLQYTFDSNAKVPHRRAIPMRHYAY